MASTYLGCPCKPWLRVDRDTWRVNESPREAREHLASRLKGWVRFRPRMFFFGFFCLPKNEEEAIPPPPTNKILRVCYIGIPIQQVKKENKTSSWHLNRFPDVDNIGSTV